MLLSEKQCEKTAKRLFIKLNTKEKPDYVFLKDFVEYYISEKDLRYFNDDNIYNITKNLIKFFDE